MIHMQVNEYVKPKTVEEALRLLDEPRNHLIGGGAWLKLTLKQADKLISLEDLKLDKIVVHDNYISIGSMVNLRTIETNSEISKLCSGVLNQAIGHVMGINIRNLATIGGTVMAKLAFSDIYPALLALDAKLLFHSAGVISFEEFLSTPHRERDILLEVRVKSQTGKGFFKKVATTRLDFAIINFAIVKSENGYRIAIGSTPHIATLAHSAMDYLNNCKQIDETAIQKAVDLTLDEIEVSHNMRASKEYRSELIKAYVKRGIRQVI